MNQHISAIKELNEKRAELMEDIKRMERDLEDGRDRYSHLIYLHRCLEKCYGELLALDESEKEENTI